MKPTVKHATFAIERLYNATPARVFAAQSQLEAVKRWFVPPPDWMEEKIELDFRVGGSMRTWGGPKGGPVIRFESRYWDIVPDRRIIYSYDLHAGDIRMSVSLTTIELHGDGKGARLVFTEQGAYFEGFDDVDGRERGTRDLLDSLAREVERARSR